MTFVGFLTFFYWSEVAPQLGSARPQAEALIMVLMIVRFFTEKEINKENNQQLKNVFYYYWSNS